MWRVVLVYVVSVCWGAVAQAQAPAFDVAWWRQQCPNNPLVPGGHGGRADPREHAVQGDYAEARIAFRDYAISGNMKRFDAVAWMARCPTAAGAAPPAVWAGPGGDWAAQHRWRAHVCELRHPSVLWWGYGPQRMHPVTAFREFDARLGQLVMNHAASVSKTAMDAAGATDAEKARHKHWVDFYGGDATGRCFESCKARLRQDCALWNGLYLQAPDSAPVPPLWCRFERLSLGRLEPRTGLGTPQDKHLRTLEWGGGQAAGASESGGPRSDTVGRWPTGFPTSAPSDHGPIRRALLHEDPQTGQPASSRIAELLWAAGLELEPIAPAAVVPPGTRGARPVCGGLAGVVTSAVCPTNGGPCAWEIVSTTANVDAHLSWIRDDPSDEDVLGRLRTALRLSQCQARLEDCVGPGETLSRSDYLRIWRIGNAAFPCFGACQPLSGPHAPGAALQLLTNRRDACSVAPGCQDDLAAGVLGSECLNELTGYLAVSLQLTTASAPWRAVDQECGP